jgi:hypothetical protein
MNYTKITVELIVIADETDAVVAGLNLSLDRLDEQYTIFGGGIETVAVQHKGVRRKSALRHTVAAAETALAAMRLAGDKVAGAIRTII